MVEHHWEICGMCGPMVVCGACGNNSCNAGYGEVNGVKCTECPSAYAKMFAYDKEVFNGIKYYQSRGSYKKMMNQLFK